MDREYRAQKYLLRMHLVGLLLTNHILACIDAPESSLPNGENRTSLSCSYQKLFKKWSLVLLKKSGISSVIREATW